MDRVTFSDDTFEPKTPEKQSKYGKNPSIKFKIAMENSKKALESLKQKMDFALLNDNQEFQPLTRKQLHFQQQLPQLQLRVNRPKSEKILLGITSAEKIKKLEKEAGLLGQQGGQENGGILRDYTTEYISSLAENTLQSSSQMLTPTKIDYFQPTLRSRKTSPQNRPFGGRRSPYMSNPRKISLEIELQKMIRKIEIWDFQHLQIAHKGHFSIEETLKIFKQEIISEIQDLKDRLYMQDDLGDVENIKILGQKMSPSKKLQRKISKLKEEQIRLEKTKFDSKLQKMNKEYIDSLKERISEYEKNQKENRKEIIKQKEIIEEFEQNQSNFEETMKAEIYQENEILIKKEIFEMQSVIQSLRDENQVLEEKVVQLKMMVGQIIPKKIESNEIDDQNNYQSRLVQIQHEVVDFNQIKASLQAKILNLQTENIQLDEKIQLYETDPQNLKRKFEIKNFYEKNIYERRCENLIKTLYFWQKKANYLGFEFKKDLKLMQKEFKKFRSKMVKKQQKAIKEFKKRVKKIQSVYQKQFEQKQIKLNKLESQHVNDSQMKAIFRSKINSLKLENMTKGKMKSKIEPIIEKVMKKMKKQYSSSKKKSARKVRRKFEI